MSVFVYGDSNVAGWRGDALKLYPRKETWPILLEKQYGHKVAADGQPGRSLCQEPGNVDLSVQQFKEAVLKVQNACILILMIGLNDFPTVQKADQVIEYINRYIEAANKPHNFYIVHPGIQFNKVPVFFQQFRQVQSIERDFLMSLDKINATKILIKDVSLVGDDGIHLSLEGHKQLAKLVHQSLEQLKIAEQ